MNDWDVLLEMLQKIPHKSVVVDEELKTIEIYDYDRHSMIFLFDNDGTLHDWE